MILNNNKITTNQTIEAFNYLFDMPDDLFKTVYPTMVSEFKKALESGEFDKEYSEKSLEEVERSIVEIDNLLDEIRNTEEFREELIEEKIEFLELILESSKEALLKIPHRNSVKVSIELCRPNAVIPTYANPTDAGCDVYAAEPITLEAGETAIVPTGLKLAIPVGWMVSIRPRSGLSLKTNLRIANAPGTIDSLYRDEVGVIMTNIGTEAEKINVGDRVVQMVIEKTPMIKFEQVDDITTIEGNRGGGYGSSGI